MRGGGRKGAGRWWALYSQVIIIRNIFIGRHEFALSAVLLRGVGGHPALARQQLARQAQLVLLQGLPLQTQQVLVPPAPPSCDSFYQIPGVKDNKNRRAGTPAPTQASATARRPTSSSIRTPSTSSRPPTPTTSPPSSRPTAFTPRASPPASPERYPPTHPGNRPHELHPARTLQGARPRQVRGVPLQRKPQVVPPRSHRRLYLNTHPVFPNTTVKIVPGPGTYVNQDAIEHNPTGQYHLSQHRNSKAKVFNPPRSRRFNKSCKLLLTQPLTSRAQESTTPRTTSPTRANTCSPRTSLLASANSSTAAGSPSQKSQPGDPSVWVCLCSSGTRQLPRSL